MSDKRNDSLLEIALELMESKRKPKSIGKLAKEVFELKGLTSSEIQSSMSQFEMDFMLSGYFICCGEDPKTGEKLWDLKNRQPFSLLDKDGNSLDDPYGDDEGGRSGSVDADGLVYDGGGIDDVDTGTAVLGHSAKDG